VTPITWRDFEMLRTLLLSTSLTAALFAAPLLVTASTAHAGGISVGGLDFEVGIGDDDDSGLEVSLGGDEDEDDEDEDEDE
jgi:hypothetical protein